jgi:hypothetical protein
VTENAGAYALELSDSTSPESMQHSRGGKRRAGCQ